MAKKLVSLKDFNSLARNKYANDRDQPIPNGIECPKCGAELFDSFPRIILASNPPQKNIHCDNCGYKGYRVT